MGIMLLMVILHPFAKIQLNGTRLLLRVPISWEVPRETRPSTSDNTNDYVKFFLIINTKKINVYRLPHSSLPTISKISYQTILSEPSINRFLPCTKTV